MKLVSIAQNDLHACVELDNLSMGGFWSEKQWSEELSKKDSICLGLKESSVLYAIACGLILIDEFHLYLITVHPFYRREGNGKRLLSGLLQAARGAGAQKVTLEVSTLNLEACSLYNHFGFKTKGLRRNYYRDGSDALIQWSDLNKY